MTTTATLPLNAELARAALPRHGFLLTFAVGLIAVAAGVTVYFFLPLAPLPATGHLVYLIKEKLDCILYRDVWNDRDFESFRNLQMATIASPWVLNEALDQPGIAALPMFAREPQVDPLNYLQSRLKTDFSPGTELMRISLEGNNPDDLLALLKALDVAYSKHVLYEERRRRQTRGETLARLQSRYEETIKNLGKQIRDLPQAAAGAEAIEPLMLDKKNAETVAARVNDELLKTKTEMDAPLRIVRWEEARISPGPEDNRRVQYTLMAVTGAIAVAGLLPFTLMLARRTGIRGRSAVATG